ncbi:MAG TPA: hypothetical protein VGI03_07020 [Verrucomicrobiae bacterium]|jgi:hypothetical protein
MKKLFPEIVLICAIIVVASYSFAQSWRPAGGGEFVPFSIATSADGKVIMVAGSGSATFSTNSGATWTTNTSFTFGNAVAVSADGTKALGAYTGSGGTKVYLSTNSGASWTQTILPPGSWHACASSADGTRLAAAILNGSIYTSTNSGTTWLTNTIASKEWESLAATADGTRIFAAANSDQIYTSTNMGSTWTPTGAPVSSWKSVAASADGSHLIATGGTTYLSTNFGSSWTPTSISGTAAASSADGSRLVVVNAGGAQIYTSTDFGADWATTNFSGKSWYSAASSADGGELLAGENQSGVWIYQLVPPPQIKITAAEGGLALSWLTPSTNLVLQQDADLTTADWVAVTNVPTLDLTNLNNEITLSPSNGNAFFRLASP